MIDNVSQILISDNTKPLPQSIQDAIYTVKQNFPNSKYRLYNKDELIELIKKHFNEDTYKSFMKLKPYSYKADLAKFCITYLKGGWYVDISIKILAQLSIKVEPDFIGFEDKGDGFGKPYYLPYAIGASLFYGTPKNIIFEKAIELIIDNCRKENYGSTPICPTGPGVLGRALGSVGLKRSSIMGHFMPLTPNHALMNRSYVLPNGIIFALHKDAWFKGAQPGDISSLGITGTNNYLSMYKSGDIFDKEIVL
tara:strand:- start:177 stop:932 length:756 start_codon:yes stop_codon:yes gene_type:complete